jgi:DNA adenine methylase
MRVSQPPECNTLFPWVGNKKFYVDFIRNHMPPGWNPKKHRYIEPFLGSGVIFAHLQPKKAILSDISPYLMTIFAAMKGNPDELYKEVAALYKRNSEETHRKVKSDICQTKDGIKRAAMFWYLLKTSLFSFVCPTANGKAITCCYKSTGKPLPMKNALFTYMSKLLQSKEVYILHEDFAPVIRKANKGDFLFLDPPYMNLKRPSRKIYNSFKPEDHERLVEEILNAHARGCNIMMFNHKHPYLENKLVSFKMIPVEHISMRKTRSHFATYEEVMFINYHVDP